MSSSCSLASWDHFSLEPFGIYLPNNNHHIYVSHVHICTVSSSAHYSQLLLYLTFLSIILWSNIHTCYHYISRRVCLPNFHPILMHSSIRCSCFTIMKCHTSYVRNVESVLCLEKESFVTIRGSSSLNIFPLVLTKAFYYAFIYCVDKATKAVAFKGT